MNLSLKQLKVFLGVANASSFTKTAQRLHLSQAALSAIIRELESQLKCRLLDRTTRTVALTEAGRLFYPTAMRIVEDLEKAALELGKLGRQEQRILRIGVTPMVGASLMPTILKRFSELNPGVNVEITDSSLADLQQMVEVGDLDAAFGAFFPKASGIEHREIFPTSLMVVSSLDDDSLGGDSGCAEVTWQALQDMPLICLPKDNPVQRLIEERLAKDNITPGKRTTVSHLDTAIAMADAGFGVAIVPSFSDMTCRRYRVSLNALHPVLEFSFYCITQAGRGAIDAVQEFAKIFVQTSSSFGTATRPLNLL